MAYYQCFPCQKLDDSSDCGGCVFKDYFRTEEEVEDLKTICDFAGKEPVKRVFEKFQRTGAHATSFIAHMRLLAPRMISLRKHVTNQVGDLRNELGELGKEVTNQVGELSNEVGELRKEVVELRVSLDILSSSFRRLVLRDTDDDSLTTVSNTQQSPDGANPDGVTNMSADGVTNMSASPSGSPDHVSESPPDNRNG